MYYSYSVKWKTLVIMLIIPLLVGGTSAIITGNSMNLYNNISVPDFAPPGIIFPIVWTILYILMGISSYMIYTSDCAQRSNALYIYALQLIINFFWPILFFKLSGFAISLVWLVFLDIAVLTMVLLFTKCKKIAGILQIPYLIWCIFATVLNYYILILNT